MLILGINMLQQRNTESCGLSGSCLGLADNVTAFHNYRDGLSLDRRRFLKTHVSHSADDLLINS